MDKNLMIAPSTDPAKTIENIINYSKEICDYADLLHCDVMDGKFVENQTYSFDAVKKIKDNTLLPLDVHLMIEKPHKKIKNFISSGANIVTIHYEAYKNKKDVIKDLKLIKELGALSGISIKPSTDVSEIIQFLSYCDLVLIMSVEPGKSGQTFMENAYEKVAKLAEIKQNYKTNFKIEVDGGINPQISQKLKSYGADIIVSGNYIYTSDNKEQAIKNLR